MSGQTSKAEQEKTAGRMEPRGRERSSQLATPGPYAELLALQRSAGNRAVDALLQGGLPPVVQSVLNSNGQPLDPALRAQMESRFDQDFSQVRVHTDARAAESAEAVSAKAYTVRRDMVFGQGRYAPETSEGKRLLAHELAHVVQQGRGTGSSSEYAGAEVEARQVGAQAASGQTVEVQTVGAGGGIQMDPKEEDDPVLREFARRQALKDNPPMGSKEWDLRFKGAPTATPGQAGDSSGQGQTHVGPAPGDERAHKSQPKPKSPTEMMPLGDPKKLRDFAEGQQEAHKKELEERSLGPAGRTDKRRALEGSPILALQEMFEAKGYGAGADIEPLKQAFLSLPPVEFLNRFPHFTLSDYELMWDYFHIGTRSWKNYIPPKGEVEASIRKMLNLPPDTYISQDRLDKLADVLANDDERAALGKQAGVSNTEQSRVYQFLNRTGRKGLYVEKDPTIAVSGYASIRQSRYVLQQQMEDIRTLSQSGLAGVGYVASIPFTDTHEQRMAVARYGALAESVAGLAGGTLATRQQMKTAGQSVSPIGRPAIIAPSNVRKPQPAKGPSGKVGTEAIDNSLVAEKKALEGGKPSSGSSPRLSANPAPSGEVSLSLDPQGTPPQLPPGPKPPLQLPPGVPDFSGVAKAIKNNPEGRGPMVGQRLGADPAAASTEAQVVKDAPAVRYEGGEIPLTTNNPVSANVVGRKPRGFDTGRAKPGRNVKPRTLEDLEPTAHKRAPRPRKTGPTRAEHLEGLEPGAKTAAQAAREEFDRKLKAEWADRLGLGKGDVLHHARELNLLDRYPNVFTRDELNSLRNMRPIPKRLNPEVHLKAIRNIWNETYEYLDNVIAQRGLRPETKEYKDFVRSVVERVVLRIDEHLPSTVGEFGKY